MSEREFAGYAVLRAIGSGGMTRLLLALDENNERVVIRHLKEEWARRWRYRHRFMHAAKVLHHLQHPNIVPLLRTGHQDRIPYMVLAYVEARTLRDLILNRDPLLTKNVFSMMRQLAALMSFIHASGYLHLDFKPENLLVQDDGKVYVIDFDLAQKRRRHPFRLRETPGTPFYVAPETLLSRRVDDRSDIYSLGVVLYEMLTYHKPYDGEHIDQVRADEVDPNVQPTRPRQYNPAIPAALEDVVLKCIAKQPEDRYPSMSLVIRDMEAIL